MGTELVYREVTAKRALAGPEFPKGVIDFDFNTGQPTAWIPSLSYFRVDMTVTGAGGAKPTLKEQIAFAYNAPSNCFDNCYFRAGGQDVSSIVNYAPQAGAARMRLMKSGAWLDNVGDSAYVTQSDFAKRQLAVSAATGGSGLGTTPVVVDVSDSAANFTTCTVALTAASGAVVGVGTDFRKAAVGDTLVLLGVSYTITAIADATNMTVSLGAAADIAANTNFYVVGQNTTRTTEGRNRIYAVYQPPIGIFQYDQPMGAGDYRFQLNPNSNYQTAAVETKNGTAGQFSFIINDVKLYVATLKVSIPNQVQTLHLIECLVQSKTASGNDTFQFTVPPSTQALLVFAQSNDAGNNPLNPPSMFTCKDGTDRNISSLQLTYGNVTKPSTRWTSEFKDDDGKNGSTNLLVQRYYDSIQEAGLVANPGGAETFDDFMKRGPMFYFSFERDEQDMSTEAQLQINYLAQTGSPTALETNAKVFLLAFHRRSTQIEVSNGQVVSVSSLMR